MFARTALIIAAGGVLIGHATAQPRAANSNCESLAKAEADFSRFVAPDKAQFTRVTPGQFHFLQGVAAINPNTPPGLPPGDSAILATADRSEEGVILFVQTGQMCLPKGAPKELVELLGRVLTDRLDAEGSEM